MRKHCLAIVTEVDILLVMSGSRSIGDLLCKLALFLGLFTVETCCEPILVMRNVVVSMFL